MMVRRIYYKRKKICQVNEIEKYEIETWNIQWENTEEMQKKRNAKKKNLRNRELVWFMKRYTETLIACEIDKKQILMLLVSSDFI